MKVVVSLVWHLVVKYAYYKVDYTKPTKCHILKLKYGWDFEAEVWSRFWSWSLVEILKLKFGQEFEAEVWLKFWSWSLVKSLKLRCGWNVEAEVWSRVWGWGVFQILGFKTSQIHLDIPSLTNTWVLNLCHQYHLPEVHFWLLDWRREKEVLLKFI